jgi:hypothetical protein
MNPYHPRKVDGVRLVRLVALLIVVGAALVAQMLFEGRALGSGQLEWIGRVVPRLDALSAGDAAGRIGLAAWLSGIALTGIGLLAPAWHGEQGRVYRRPNGAAVRAYPGWTVWAAGGATVLLAAAATAQTVRDGGQPGAVWLWLASLVGLAATGWVIQQRRVPVAYASRYAAAVNPERGWPYLVLIVLAALGLYLSRLPDLPARVDLATAGAGLAARTWAAGDAASFLVREPVVRPLPTLLVTTAAVRSAGDALWGVRLAGMLAALATIVAIWLLGCELFRRVPAYEQYGEVVEDDGRWMALAAALTAACSVALFHFGRVPVLLEPVAWGTLGLWALLRGLRLDRMLLLAVSAGSLAWAVLYGPVGWVFAVAALLTWLGAAFWEPAWLEGRTVVPRAGGDPVRVQQGVGRTGFFLWLVGLGIGCAPLAAMALREPALRFAPWAWWGIGGGSTAEGWLSRLAATALALVQPVGMAGSLWPAAHFVPSLLTPALMLGLGALILSIDSVMGWALTTWSATAILAIALLAPSLPNWPAMLALLPMVCLVIAFGLDRLRVLVMNSAGTWAMQATVYLALGLIVAAGIFGWVGYFGFAQRDADLATAVGRALSAAGERPVVLARGSGLGLEITQDAVVQMLAGDAAVPGRVTEAILPQGAAAVPGARILIAPGEWLQVQALEAIYPGGALKVVRDVRANPVLYIFDLPIAQ